MYVIFTRELVHFRTACGSLRFRKCLWIPAPTIESWVISTTSLCRVDAELLFRCICWESKPVHCEGSEHGLPEFDGATRSACFLGCTHDELAVQLFKWALLHLFSDYLTQWEVALTMNISSRPRHFLCRYCVRKKKLVQTWAGMHQRVHPERGNASLFTHALVF